MKTNLGRFVDIVVVGAALAVGAGAIYNLTGNKKVSGADSSSQVSEDGRAKSSVGKVVPLGQDVRRKGSSHDWSQVLDSQAVYEQDRVYAGEGSRARVDLDSGGRLYVSSSSLVTISRLKEDEVANIESGSLIGELLKGGRLLIKQKDKITELTGQGKFLIEKSTRGIHLEVLKGSFSIKKSNQTKQVSESAKVTIAEDNADAVATSSSPLEDIIKIEPPPTVTLVSPAQGDSVWMKSSEVVRFHWQGAVPGRPVKFSIAYSADFKKGLFSTVVQGDSYKLKVSPLAQYYWKVESADDESAHWESSTGLFATWLHEGPQLVVPQEKSVLKDNEQKPIFAWHDKSDSIEYLLEVARDAEFKEEFLSQRQNDTSWSPEKDFPEGQYFWRVTSSRPGREDFVSAVGSFSKTKSQPVILPALSLAKSNLNFEIFENENYDPKQKLSGYNYTKEVVISCPVVTSAKVYEWDVRSTAQGRIFSKTYSTDQPELKDSELQVPSLYAIKVRYKNDAEQWSEWSDVASARVVLAPPRLLIEQNKSIVTLKWTQIKNVPLYEFMTSQDAKFTVADVKKSDTNKYAYENLVAGVYFARVRTLNINGWPTSAWSKATTFDVTVPHKIVATPKVHLPKKNESKDEQLAKKLFDQRHVASVSDESVSNQSLAAIKTPIEDVKPKKVRNVSLYSGIGTNYLKFDQSDSSGLESGKFSSVTSPTLMVEAGVQWNENWHYGASFHEMPGSIMNNPSTTINQTDYKWSYLGLEAERKIFDNLFGARVSIMGGVQRHEMPFLIGGTNTDVELIQTQLTTGALGFHAEWSPYERWQLEAFMRYQVPLMSSGGSGGVFHVTSGTSYDGLIGVSRKIFDNWKVGVYWFGQSHDLNYTYKSDDGSNDREGKQILFNSDLQVRFGYAWYFGQMVFVFSGRRKSKQDEDQSEDAA